MWLMDDGVLSSGHDMGVIGPSWQVADTGDYSADGRSDILWRDSAGTTALWEMDGSTITAGHALALNVGPSWHVVNDHLLI
jgi:hypothetical protein